MRSPAARRQAIQALIDGATTPGEKAAAEAALRRHDESHGHVDPTEDLADVRRIVREKQPERVWPFPGRGISYTVGGWGLHKRVGRIYLAWPPWSGRESGGRFRYQNMLMALSWIVDPDPFCCQQCWRDYPAGTGCWRALVYSGIHPVSHVAPRKERWCGRCLAPPWGDELSDRAPGLLP